MSKPIDFVRAFEDTIDPLITINGLDWITARKTVASVNLYAFIGAVVDVSVPATLIAEHSMAYSSIAPRTSAGTSLSIALSRSSISPAVR